MSFMKAFHICRQCDWTYTAILPYTLLSRGSVGLHYKVCKSLLQLEAMTRAQRSLIFWPIHESGSEPCISTSTLPDGLAMVRLNTPFMMRILIALWRSIDLDHWNFTQPYLQVLHVTLYDVYDANLQAFYDIINNIELPMLHTFHLRVVDLSEWLLSQLNIRPSVTKPNRFPRLLNGAVTIEDTPNGLMVDQRNEAMKTILDTIGLSEQAGIKWDVKV
jgi:hypothetical protein